MRDVTVAEIEPHSINVIDAPDVPESEGRAEKTGQFAADGAQAVQLGSGGCHRLPVFVLHSSLSRLEEDILESAACLTSSEQSQRIAQIGQDPSACLNPAMI